MFISSTILAVLAIVAFVFILDPNNRVKNIEKKLEEKEEKQK